MGADDGEAQLRGAAALGGAKVVRLFGLSALVLVAFGLYAFSYFPDTVQVHPPHTGLPKDFWKP